MRNLLFLIILFPLFTSAKTAGGSSQNDTSSAYGFNKKYTIAQLKTDFVFFRNILEHKHPRLYEYTTKKELDHFLDSLYLSINNAMTEREFQYFLAPAVNKVHCSHTKLLPSQYLLDHMDDYFKAPAFKLFFTPEKVWLQDNYSPGSAILAGAQIFSINNIPIEQIRSSFLNRLPREGMNETFMYNRMNTAMWPNNGVFGLFPGLCDYPVIDTYEVCFQNPGSRVKQTAKLPAMPYASYPPLMAINHKPDYSFYTIDSLNTAVLTIASFLHSDEDHAFQHFIDSVFTFLNKSKCSNLIIDVRGNIGGIPEGSVEILRHIMPQKFVYYSNGRGYADYKRPIALATNRFKGKVFFLIDGGCRSTTGHFLAMAKYYHLGMMIGEESCASHSCNDNGAPYTLPNTRLVFNCSASTYSVAVKGLKRGRGIFPDYSIKPTINDVVAMKDPAMQFALKSIRH